jgi:hypothetical protein
MRDCEAEALPRIGTSHAGCESLWYTLGALNIRSDFRLPLPAATSGPDDLSSVVDIRYGPAPLYDHRPELTEQASRETSGQSVEPQRIFRERSDGAWWWWEDTCTFHITPDAGVVSVFPEGRGDESSIGLLLAGPIATLVHCARGYPTLHASAVVAGAGAVAFLGFKGDGKSTMASAFLRRGASLLTDDVLPVLVKDGAFGLPGPARLRVSTDTAQLVLGLDPTDLPDVRAAYPKKLVTSVASTDGGPVRLRALYLLDRRGIPGNDTTVATRPIFDRQALGELLRYLIGAPMLSPNVMGHLLPILGGVVRHTPVRYLSYPSGFEHHDAVYAHVMRELDCS